MESMNMEQWVGIKKISCYLDVKEVTLRKWIKEEKIPCYKIGRQWKFKIAEIDKWVESGASEFVAIVSDANRKKQR